jgi:septal ring factor EnvC (AmiA/AmiB activator)
MVAVYFLLFWTFDLHLLFFFFVSLGNQRAPNDVWNNPQLLDLKQEIDSVADEIKVKEGELKILRHEKRKASSPEDKAEFQEEIDELKQSIADLKAKEKKLLEQRRELTQSLSGNTGNTL